MTSLQSIGVHKYGTKNIEFYQCLKCTMEFPVLQGVISCNNKAITDCPWCSNESRPWTNGRGI